MSGEFRGSHVIDPADDAGQAVLYLEWIEPQVEGATQPRASRVLMS